MFSPKRKKSKDDLQTNGPTGSNNGNQSPVDIKFDVSSFEEQQQQQQQQRNTLPYHTTSLGETFYSDDENHDVSGTTSQSQWIGEDLAVWCSKYNISNVAANELLAILSKKINGLPKDISSLKRTQNDETSSGMLNGGNIFIKSLPIGIGSIASSSSLGATLKEIQAAINDACQKAVDKVEERNRMILASLVAEVNGLRREVAELKMLVGQNYSVLPKVPFTDLEGFLAFERTIGADEEKFNQLKIDLNTISKCNTKKFVKSAWKRFMTDSVAEKISWRGTEEKISAQSLLTTTAIRNTFVLCNGGSEEDFATASKCFFQLAKHRQKTQKNPENPLVFPNVSLE